MAMSKKMQLTLDAIRYSVEHARELTYEEWLGKTKPHPALRDLYNEERSGVVHGHWDGRTLNALEKRGYIRYFDDMNRDDWCVILVEK